MALWDDVRLRFRLDEPEDLWWVNDDSDYSTHLNKSFQTGYQVFSKGVGFHGGIDTATFLQKDAKKQNFYTSSESSIEINTNEITIAAWVKLVMPGVLEKNSILVKGYTGEFWDTSYALYVDSSQKLNLTLAKSPSQTGDFYTVTGVTTIAFDTWYHVMGILLNGVMRLYVNNVDEGVSTSFTWNIYSSTQILRLGNDWSNGSDTNYNGYIKDVCLWARGLSEADRTELFRLDENLLDVGQESIKFYLTGASSDGGVQTDNALSLGGYRSSTEITSDVANNIFNDVINSERITGKIEYRCMAVKNTNLYKTLALARAWIDLISGNPQEEISIAVEVPTGGDTNGYAQTVGAEITAPIVGSGNVSDWVNLDSQKYALDVDQGSHDQNLDISEIIFIWIKREISELCSPRTSGFDLKFGESTMRGYQQLTGLSNCAVLPSRLGVIKNGGASGSFDTDGYSIEFLDKYYIGSGVSFRRPRNIAGDELDYNIEAIVGLDPTPSGNDSNITMKFCWYITSAGNATVWTDGVQRYSAAYSSNNLYTIEMKYDGNFEFKENDVVKYTTSSGNGDVPLFPLYLDTGLYSPQDGLTDFSQVWELFLIIRPETTGGIKKLGSLYDVVYDLPSSDDLKFYLTGASSDGGVQNDPAFSLGNYRSLYEIVSDDMNNIFKDYLFSGGTRYMCVAVRNEATDNIFEAFRVFIQSQADNTDVVVSIAVEVPTGGDTNGYAQTILDVDTSPNVNTSNTIVSTGNVSDWSSVSDRDNGVDLNIGNKDIILRQQELIFIWIKCVVNATNPEGSVDFTLRFSTKRDHTPVLWKDVIGLEHLPRSGHLYKSGGLNSWTDNYAAGSHILEGKVAGTGVYFYRRIYNEDGVGDNDKSFVVGLNEAYYGQPAGYWNPYDKYDYCWYITSAGNAEVWTKGVQRYSASYGSYQNYEIVFAGGQLQFKEDGNTRYSTTGGDTPDSDINFYLESVIYTNGPRYVVDVQMLWGTLPSELTKDLISVFNIAGLSKFYLTGALLDGGTQLDPNSSLGNYRSSTEVTTEVLNNLFDNVKRTQRKNGYTDYRCICVRNDDSVNTVLEVSVYLQQAAQSLGVTISFAVEVPTGGDTNGYAQQIADEVVSPVVNAGNASDWSTSSDRSNGVKIDIGAHDTDMAPYEIIFIWIKRVVDINSFKYLDDNFIIKVDGLNIIDIDWTNATNVVASPNPNDLNKNSGGDAWNGSAISSQKIKLNYYGSGIKWKLGQTNYNLALGLSEDDLSDAPSDIEFYFLFQNSGNIIEIKENLNVIYTTTNPYNTGNIFSVIINMGGFLEFYKDSSLLVTSVTSINFPIFVDTSIYNQGASFLDVQMLMSVFNLTDLQYDLEKGISMIPEHLGIKYLTRGML